MSFHLFRINELYSNPTGTIQFIELTVGNFNGESHWAGVAISSSREGVTHTFTFPSDLPSSRTANKSVLVATQAFADLGLVAPDFIMPAGFLFTSGGSLNFGGVDTITYAELPVDGVRSLARSGDQISATPTNFAGTAVSVPVLNALEINGSSSNDVLTGTTSNERIDGQAGNDTLSSGGGNDLLLGGTGDDVIHSGSGNDTIDGGDGYDYLYFSAATAGVVINLATGTANGGAGSDSIAGVELVFGSSFNDTFIGNDASVGFLGGDGNDTITGGAGRDHLEGNGGDDTIDGLGGVDIVAYYSAAFAVNVNLTTGQATGGLGKDTLRNIEDVTGSVFGDTLTGSTGDNRLEGSDGNDTLISTRGNDTLDGGSGVDTLVFALARSTYTLQRSAGGTYSIEKPDSAGADTLVSVERLQFADRKIALDIDGHAGTTAKVLGAVFGADSVHNLAYVGIGLGLLDDGMSYQDLMQLALNVRLGADTSHQAVVNLLYTNVIGNAPPPDDLAFFTGLLDSGTLTPAGLGVIAANTPQNAVRIDLVGLQESGIAFV